MEKTFSKNRKYVIASLLALTITLLTTLVVATVLSWNGYHQNYAGSGSNLAAFNEHNIFGQTYKAGVSKDIAKIGWTWSNVTSSYKLLFFGGISIAVIALFFVGSWLRGSKWINKINPYIEGKTYIRTSNQILVFRTLAALAGILVLWSFWIEAWWDFRGKGTLGNFFTDYLFDTSSWYYQCFLSSLFIGVALITRKYKYMPVILPLAMLGGLRSFIDPSGDWGEAASWHSVYFHRFMMIHISITIIPIFIMYANRIRYSLVTIKRTIIYTFLMMFIAYFFISSEYFAKEIRDRNKKIDLDQYGELVGAGILLGKDGDWINTHSGTYFWLILCPFGAAIITAFALITNSIHFISIYKKQMFKNWLSTVKNEEWSELKSSFRMHKRIFNLCTKENKVKLEKLPPYVPFGVNPKGNK